MTLRSLDSRPVLGRYKPTEGPNMWQAAGTRNDKKEGSNAVKTQGFYAGGLATGRSCFSILV